MIEKIEKLVCDYEGIIPSELHVKNREDKICETRQIVMYFALIETGMTQAATGAFYGLDHATAYHAEKTVKALMDSDKKFNAKIRFYEKEVRKIKRIPELKRIKINRNIDKILNEIPYIESRLDELQERLHNLKIELLLNDREFKLLGIDKN